MQKVCWPYFDPDFDTLPERINGPECTVTIDNESMEDYTVVKVDGVNKQGLLLEVVQVLTDLNLQITKSYISSDAGWFMDVFHVRNQQGHKVRDQKVINSIQQALSKSAASVKTVKAKAYFNKVSLSVKVHENERTAIELSGTDRPGLFSEISAALNDLHCKVVEAHAWSHNARLACVAYISDESTDSPIEDPNRLASIEDHLTTVLRATTTSPTEYSTTMQEAKTTGYLGGEGTMSDVERRLHQLMLSVGDIDGPSSRSSALTSTSISERDEEISGRKTPVVTIDNCEERGYSMVTIECDDRPRLMFDTVCTLTDMQYVIFHAATSSNANHAFQDYFIRDVDGYALNTDSEKQRVIKCLEAAIERRVCEGVRLELCAEDRIGLLSDITRILRENGLTVVRADVETLGGKCKNAFYVRDISGNEVDMDFVESMKREIMGPIVLQVWNERKKPDSPVRSSRFSLGDLFKSKFERFSHSLVTSLTPTAH